MRELSMNIYSSDTYIENIYNVMRKYKSLFGELEGKAILITGATGLICSCLVDLLFFYCESEKKHIDIYVTGRSYEKACIRFDPFVSNSNFHFVKFNSNKINDLNIKVDYIIHGASYATPYFYENYPIDTMLGNFIGMYGLLEYAVKEQVKRVLFISSSEVYGKKYSLEPYEEKDFGYVDILTSRAAYPMSKRATETLCACYNKEKDVDIVIVRPGHIYGPTASQNDNRVVSEFIRRAVSGENIIMKSRGEQIRSYCYTFDCATAILTVLLHGEIMNAYNISNAGSILSIKQMADLIADLTGVKIVYNSPSKKEKETFNPMQNSSLNCDKLKMLGWKELFNAKQGFGNTIKIIREIQSGL